LTGLTGFLAGFETGLTGAKAKQKTPVNPVKKTPS
jgi:hypothetical protein